MSNIWIYVIILMFIWSNLSLNLSKVLNISMGPGIHELI